ncbi:hypothetical protein I5535_13640 [Rhodobacteraceae bacterium F11138]|nr:hypothetical protein [Rhodobacteraceae bacterium F11138]
MPRIEQWELQTKIFEKKCAAIEKDAAKNCALKDADSLKSQMKTNRKAAYDKEDKMAETIPEAIKKGITGKKWKDFLGDKDFKKAMESWEAALAVQQELVQSLEKLSDTAKKHHQDLKRALADYEKDIKKSGETAKSNKAIKKVQDKAQALLKQLDDAKGAFGTLSAKEAFFGANVKKSKDAVVSKALKEGQGDQLPDILLENAKRQQTDNTSKRLVRNIDKFVNNAKMLCAKDKFSNIPDDRSTKTALQKDVQNARASLKMASEHLKKLQSLNKDLQAAKKKQMKLIAAHNDKSKMNDLIGSVADLCKSGEEAYNAAEDLVEDADTAL